MRPNIHIEDVADLYVRSLEWPEEAIDGQVFNAGYENHRVLEIAQIAREVVGKEVEIVTTPTNDHRSYHISSEKINRELGFVPQHSIQEAVVDLVAAFNAGKAPGPMTDPRYYNIKTMQALKLR
jgi:nucleoside-diphosphate-sugar epimerase